MVLLHGFGTSGFLWRNVAPALPLGRVTAFAADFFGWGESDRSLEADYGIAAQAEYLDRALTVLRVARADVVAVDLGCAVALALAARRPERVRSMVLVNPGDPSALRSGEFGELKLLGPILEKSVARPEAMPPVLLRRYAAPFVGRDGVRHLMQLERAINDQALADVLWERIAAPVLVVRGDADSWVAPDVAATVASRLPHAEHRRMSGAARLVPEDAPVALAELLREWIGPETQGD